MTTPPALTDVQLREAVCAAILAETDKPRADRLGLVDAMLAVVWPQLDAARRSARASEESATILQRQIDAQAAELDLAARENHLQLETLHRRDAELTRLREQLAEARNLGLIEAAAIASTVLSPLGQLETLYALHDRLLAARTAT